MRWSQIHSLHFLFFFFHICATTPTARYLQSAVYDAKSRRAVFLGGTTSIQNVSSDVFAMDLSMAFNRSSANFTTLPSLLTPVSDSAAIIDHNARIIVLGGQQMSCSTSLVSQTYLSNDTTWNTAISTGSVPGPRRGARAILVNDEIQYFGGKSLSNCSSSQYYYNTLYHVDPTTLNWTISTSLSPPVAEAGMTLSSFNAGSFMLVGGEAVSSSATASWVGMTQFAQYNANSSTWSYLSASTSSGTTVTARTGHSAVFNGTHTFIFGGSIGSTVSTPTFLIINEQDSSVNVTTVALQDSSTAPTASLYGHSAILTENGIMVLAFGLVGSATSTTYNTQIYLYDTIQNKWLDSFDPTSNANALTTGKSSGLSTGSVVAMTLTPLVSLTVALILVLSFYKRRQDRRKRLRAFPINRLGTFTPDKSEHEFDSGSFTDEAEKRQDVHLPPWAAMHACQARSKFAQSDEVNHATTPDPVREKFVRHNQDYDIQDVQFACPASPQNMTFRAPRLQLRVVNPDAGSSRNSFDVSRTIPELVETSRSGLTTSVPLSITNEDDLELLRSKLSNSPMMGDIEGQLAGLGLVIREDTVRNTSTGELQRVRTIRREKSKRMPDRRETGKPDGTLPRLSIVSNLSSSLDLDALLAIGTNLSPVPSVGFHGPSPDQSSYSPYLDSPQSSRAASPKGRQQPLLDLNPGAIHPPGPVKRGPSWASNSSRTALFEPWPSLNVKRPYSG